MANLQAVPWEYILAASCGALAVALAIALLACRNRLWWADITSIGGKTLIRSADDGILILDRRRHILDLNPSACLLIGHERKEALRQPAPAMIPFWPKLTPCLDTLRVHQDITIERRGTAQHFQIQVLPLPGWFGQQHRQMIILHNISECKHLNRALQAGEQQYRTLIEHANDGIIIVQDNLIKYINPQMEAIIGRSAHQVQDKPFETLIPPQRRAELVERYERRLRNEPVPSKYETTLYGRDENLVQVEISAGITEYASQPAVLAFVRDITQRKQTEQAIQCLNQELEQRVNERTARLASTNQQLLQEIKKRIQVEEALRQSERRFRNLFESAPLCIFEFDLEQIPPIILHANRQVEITYGWTSAELTDATIDRLFPPESVPELAEIVQALLDGKTITKESVSQRQDGSKFDIRISAASEERADLSRVIFVVEDISVETSLRSEEEAIRQERQRIAQEIHDGLAQNLAALRFRVRQLHRLVEQDPQQLHAELDDLRKVLSESIIEVRRSIFALRPIALEEHGLLSALERFSAGFSEHYQVRVNLEFGDLPQPLPTSLELIIFRAIQEAINNVGKHAQASTVWIKLEQEADDRIALFVQDDGRGFDPAQIPSGSTISHIGLTQMRERIEYVSGTLDIQSQPDRGTTIRISLPIRAP